MTRARELAEELRGDDESGDLSYEHICEAAALLIAQAERIEKLERVASIARRIDFEAGPVPIEQSDELVSALNAAEE